MTEPEELVRRVLGAGTAVGGVRRLSGGASREMWSLTADGRPLILRRGSPGMTVDAGAGLAVEAGLMRAALAAGVPVPAIVAAGDDFILMEHVEGETIPRRILRDPRYAGARPNLADQCGRILAAIHRMPPPAVLTEAPDPLEFWRSVLDACGEPHPVFEWAFVRLARTRPPARRTAVVHGDFRNGNLIVGPEGVRAVLDWELAHLGDPVEDLGWLCVRAWRFGSPLPVGGFGTYDRLVASYEKAGGDPVDPAALRWWEAFGVLKWGIICVMQTLRHVRGGEDSVELAALGRRVCENEWDLLELLG
ncbi:phosphotransferase family protein [Bailinhaonella thermotolerans]|uniref:Phosphotransferase family protein n=1 Tax=Bailinhaonella thermotolerans TaxID=1070861 RepID=A0A3A4A0W4_9ACTN|nr:phosphotransferase family protein [Bailinhaonella thermotolerans]RJL20801.1 phosphotransferase family protein [Bailinhaonella thermotolerans]